MKMYGYSLSLRNNEKKGKQDFFHRGYVTAANITRAYEKIIDTHITNPLDILELTIRTYDNYN